MTGMKRAVTGCVLAAFACALGAGQPAEAQDLQQKLAAAMQSAAQNQQALRSYGWIEKVELSLKGEVKNTTVNIQVRITNSNYRRLAQ
jgi:hypothetical protein